jgi:hypothetical protein
VCTYETQRLSVTGSAKGESDWWRFSDVTVYFDNPVHAPAEHSLCVDFLDLEGSGARIGVELDPVAARALAGAILDSLDYAERMGLVPQS